jgi:hypothetical protein
MTIKKISVTEHSDNGHGWVAVKRDVLNELGILHQVSHYSYQRGGTVYLEEDRDATLFYTTIEAKGLQDKLAKKRGKYPASGISPVRSYEHFALLWREEK